MDTKIPEPLTRHFAVERRELLTEAPAMARVLEGLAKSLHKIAAAGEAANLHEFTWTMSSLAAQGGTALALARSAADLARHENLLGALTRDADKATAATAPVSNDEIRRIALIAADAGDAELVKLCKRALGTRPEDADPEARATLLVRWQIFTGVRS